MAQKLTHYDVGDLWTPQATFTVAGVNTDPTNLTVRQQDAAGAETTLLNNVLVSTLNASSSPVAKTATGIFQLNPGITLSAPGYWFVKFEGTGAATATETQEAIVDPDEFGTDTGLSAQALVGLAETKNFLQQRNIDTSNDLELARIINDVSDRFTFESGGREFKPINSNPATRDFDMEMWNWRIRTIEIGDLASLTAASIITYALDGTVADTTTLTVGNLVTLPRVRQPWEPITQVMYPISIIQPAILYRAVFRVTGTWGFPAVPGNVRQAILNAVAAVLDKDIEHYRQDLGAVQPSSSAGGEAGNVILMAGRAQKILSLPPATMAVAWSFRGDAVLV